MNRDERTVWHCLIVGVIMVAVIVGFWWLCVI
jgi:hypothetical protein